jgi:biopolymer transport protein ExbD
MARKHRVSHIIAGELNLTAMIDVAFQLLSFFVITIKPVDTLSTLDFNRPAPTPPSDVQPAAPPPSFRLHVLPDGSYTVNERSANKEYVDRELTRMAKINKQVTILIMCSQDSPHGALIEVLDDCTRLGLQNLSVLSTP